ncbi:MAG: outer membrane protein assembly factor BamD [Marinifilaceae bacterium]|nr:outer membrane protein assembly factor BamD [Marinifilaceae bacterium]
MMKNFIGFLLVILVMTSCSEYQKLLKSGDYQAMYKKAIEYYNSGDYTKASSVFDGIRMVFTGTSKAQTIAYYRAFCAYNQKDYEYAAELFKQFVATYPETSYVEECLYMIGYCNYLASPKPRLDQSVTEKAMNDFQLYLSRYPNSERKEQINEYMDAMRDKLSYKDYLSAKNYYLREKYKAAVVSLENCLKDYPGTKYREEIMYMLFASKYEMAVNSVEDKKYERYNAAAEEYYYFLEEYPESRYIEEMTSKNEHITAYLRQYDVDEEE